MSVEPPAAGRPTGPPAGPLSGPTRDSPTQPSGRTPAEPPSDASGGRGDGGGGGEGDDGGGTGGPSGPGGPVGPGEGSGKGPDHPWWKSAPSLALISGVAVAAVVLGLVLTRSDGTSSAEDEVLLEAVGKPGPDPFTESTAKDSSAAPVTPSASAPASADVPRGVYGSTPGLYSGIRNVASCDVEKQIKALQTTPTKNEAFASTQGIEAAAVPAYLRSLTAVQLRMDTRVTNHGYRDGASHGYQAILQAGTAVLVDGRGVPRVRCGCGNPLLPPVAQKATPKRTGDTWSSFRPQNVVVVSPAKTIINVFVIYDPDDKEWVARHRGDSGGHRDKKTHAPTREPAPTASVSAPAASSPSSLPPPSSSSAAPPPSSPARPSSSLKPSSPSPESSAPPSSPSPSSPSAPYSPDSPSPSKPSSSAPSTRASESAVSPSSVSPGTTAAPSSSVSAPETSATSPEY
ncbi:DUF6777 domain-containing protein [Streptomyces sp. SD15]